MEKNRWSLIFIGLCLALVFSMSPVEAQAEKGPRCSDEMDNDGDNLIDCDDPDCKCGDPEPTGTVTICHFSPNRKHCGGIGGLERTIQINKLDGHLDHGDCKEGQYNFECGGHCQPNTPFGDNQDCSDLNP